MSTQKSVSTKGSHHQRSVRPVNETARLFARLKRGSESTFHDTLKKSVTVSILRSKYNKRPEEIAQESGISPAHIYNMLKIDAMPKVVKDFIKEGRLGASEALQIARKQKNEKSFIADVESYIKAKEKQSNSDNHFHALTFLKREQMVNNKKKISPEKRSELKTQLEELISQFSPNRIPVGRIRACTNIITQLIAG